jgi:hypothetical protein
VALIGKSAGKSFAYLVGVFLGDGCVSNTSAYQMMFRLNTIDADFAAATTAALEEVGYESAVRTHEVKRGRPNHALVCHATPLCRWLRDVTDYKKRIPASIFLAPRDHQLAFIAGLMDSEGFVGANSNPTNRRFYMGFKSCDPWVPDFIRLLEITGIRIGKVQTEAPLKPGYKAPTRFTIKMQSWIDAGGYFNIRRKQERVEAWASEGAFVQKARRKAEKRRLTSETNMQSAA